MNVTSVNQIRDLHVDRRIISSQSFRNWTLHIRKFSGTRKKTKTRVYRSTRIDKTLRNNTYEIESQKIYAPMARMYTNTKMPRRNY